MIIKRNIIQNFRQKIKELTADTEYANQFLYSVLLEHAKWLVKREIRAGKVYKNMQLFQSLKCISVVPASIISAGCPIQLDCPIWRTDKKLPDTWQDDYGPVIKYATSVDDFTRFHLISKEEWMNKQNSPYFKYDKTKYVIYSDGYLWFPKHNPRKINVYGFFIDDVVFHSECGDTPRCTRFLDTTFNIPDWIEAEVMSKAVEQIANITKKLPQDEQIDKNETRRS